MKKEVVMYWQKIVYAECLGLGMDIRVCRLHNDSMMNNCLIKLTNIFCLSKLAVCMKKLLGNETKTTSVS
jgi:hypothetical protein